MVHRGRASQCNRASHKSASRPTRKAEDRSGLGAERTDHAAIGSRSDFGNAQLKAKLLQIRFMPAVI